MAIRLSFIDRIKELSSELIMGKHFPSLNRPGRYELEIRASSIQRMQRRFLFNVSLSEPRMRVAAISSFISASADRAKRDVAHTRSNLG